MVEHPKIDSHLVLLLNATLIVAMYCTYILYSVSYDRYYIGHCENVTARLLRHNSKKVNSTRPYIPWNLVYYEEYATLNGYS